MRDGQYCGQTGYHRPMSALRKTYIARLVGRCVILLLCAGLWLIDPAEFSVLDGRNFFGGFSVLHLLWGIWVVDMVAQLFPVPARIALGSHKVFRRHFRPVPGGWDRAALRRYTAGQYKRAGLVLVLWAALIAVLGLLHYIGLISNAVLFLISVLFYVCDLICVLIWCPFRLILGNRCCTTCRIFNWDHMMMFSPLIFAAGFYGWSLVVMSLIVWLAWELTLLWHPERFWVGSNAALRCAGCADKLCIQYCEKRWL